MKVQINFVVGLIVMIDSLYEEFVLKIMKWQWRYIIKMVGEIRIHAAADLLKQDVKCAGNSWKTGKILLMAIYNTQTWL